MSRQPDSQETWPQSSADPGRELRLDAVPLFYAAWLFAAGIAAAHCVWLRQGWLLVALASAAILCSIAIYRAERIVWLPMAVLWVLLGAWCAEMEPQPSPSPQLAALANGLMRDVDGTVINADTLRDESISNPDVVSNDGPSQRVDVQVENIEVVNDSMDRMEPATGAVRLTVRWPADTIQATSQALHCGDRIRASVPLQLPVDYRTPGAWSRTAYLLDQKITATASMKIERIEKLAATENSGSPWQRWKWTRAQLGCWLHATQQNVSARILALPAAMRSMPESLRLNHDDAVVMAAMTTGDRTYLTQPLRQGFERTGSFHMLVVSGLHMAIVAGCLLWLARKLRLPQLPATLATIAASFAYALFTGFATPVQRSLWMVTLYLLARLIYRQRSPLNTVGFAALCLLAVSPRALLDSGFQMTLLAVVSIAGVGAPLLEKTVHPYWKAAKDLRLMMIDVKLEPRLAQFRVILRMLAQRLERAFSARMGWQIFPWCVRFFLRCVELVVIACVVELAMSLPMALYFHRITVFALPVNVLILPLLSVLMPSALLTLLVLLMWPVAAVIPAMMTASLLHAGMGMVRLFGSLAWGDLRVATPLAWQCVLFYAALATALVLASGGSWSRRAAWAAMLLAGFAAVIPHPVDHPHDALLVEAIDVGQGDSLLLITPAGKKMLVDGGGIGGNFLPTGRGFDVGEEVVSEALWARGIRQLDVVALTHGHSDHMGGLPAVLRNFRPKELWVGNNPPVEAYIGLLNEAAELGVKVRSLREGDVMQLGSASVRVLAPPQGYAPGPEPRNNDSLVLRVAYGQTSVLMAGDAEAEEEQSMLGEPDFASTLLKVGHHGSATSTTPAFLARVAPKWAVISCGLHNRFGHPREEVLRELQDAKVKTFSTDVDGAVCFRLDGKTVQAEARCGTGASPGMD